MESNRTRCAGGIVLGDAGTIAMVHSRKNTKWFFPKGHVDPGEDDETAARREVFEETGLTNLEIIDDLGEYERHRINEDGQYDLSELKTIQMYLFVAPPHSEIKADHEIEEARWVSLPHVAEALENDKDKVWFASVFDRVRQAIQRD